MTPDQRERDELCDLFLELGPDAPTLCEGWTTLDLAAHLAVREREPLAALGIMVPRLADRTRHRQDRWADRGLEAVVAALRRPPLVPWRVPKLRVAVNLLEYAVHHEDARRANGRGPRTDRPDLDRALWPFVRATARLAARRIDGAALVLVSTTGDRASVGKGEQHAVLSGAPLELALYLSGRRGAARVELHGPAEAVAAVESAALGL